MTRFEFTAPTQIIFGEGVLKEVKELAASLGKRALLVAGHRGPDIERLRALVNEKGLAVEEFPVNGEPDISLVMQGLKLAKESGSDLVIAFGGGSAIDTGKAISALMTNPGEPLDYLEVVGKNQPLRIRAAPLIAIPTTAGTGSEVTRNAVLAVPEKGVKVSLRSPLMMARVALVDPELTYALPPEITASTGMDALAQVIEPYVSRRANPFTDLYCREGISRGASALLRAYQGGAVRDARGSMAFTSLMGGLALANAGLGAVHGFASVIGGMYKAPHGAVCAALLPPVVEVNTRALLQREPENPAYRRYLEVARAVTGEESISRLVDWLLDLRKALHIPGLGQYGVSEHDCAVLVEKTAVASSTKANPIVLTNEELTEIVRKAI